MTSEISFYERYTKSWRVANPDKVIEYRKRDYQKNRDSQLEKAKQWRNLNPEKVKAYSTNRRDSSNFNRDAILEYQHTRYETVHGRGKTLIGTARHRAYKKELEFNLDMDWIVPKLEAGVCEVTGCVLSFTRLGKGLKNPFSPSLDRIDCSKGYIKDNCQLTCCLFNVAKNDFSEKDVETMARSYINKLDTKQDK